MAGPDSATREPDARRARTRRLAILLALLAAAVYLGFIGMQVLRGRG